jgi:hypothetical protein
MASVNVQQRLKQLSVLASKIGIRNAILEERRDINNDTLEYAIMGNGYITNYDIDLLAEKGFTISAIYATAKNELLILVKEI